MRDFLRRFAERSGDGSYAFSDTRVGILVGLLSIGALLGALLTGPISTRFGRRKTMMFWCFIFCVGNIIQIASFTSWVQFTIGRLVSGFSIGGLSVLVPVYVSETVPKEVRGAMVAAYQLFVTLGIFFSYLINYGTSHTEDTSASWRVPLGIGFLFPAALALGMFFLPETPRWLLTHNHRDKAYQSLQYINGKRGRAHPAVVDAQMAEMEHQILSEKAMPKASWLASFSPRGKTLYRTILGFSLQMFQQLTGANYFFYYGATIFRAVGIDNSYVTQMILGVVNIVCTFPGLWFIERFGRRKPLIYGGLWQCAWLIVFGAVGSERDPNEKSIGAVLIVSACMFIAGFASTWGPGVWVATGEMFPTRTRAHQASFATAGNWGWNFLLTFFTPRITSAIGYRLGYVFAGCNLLAVAIVFFFYYESSNLTLEQVDDMYNDRATKPWTSGGWVPAGYSSRKEAAAEQEARAQRQLGLAGSNGYEGEKPAELGGGGGVMHREHGSGNSSPTLGGSHRGDEEKIERVRV